MHLFVRYLGNKPDISGVALTFQFLGGIQRVKMAFSDLVHPTYESDSLGRWNPEGKTNFINQYD